MRWRASVVGAALSIGVPILASLSAAQPAGSAAVFTPAAHDCLARALYFEAGIERREGMIAVGWVILNRMAHPDFPPTVCEVVKEGGEVPGCQFAFWCDGRSDTPRDPAVWREARRAAEDLLTGRTVDPTRGALFFHAASLPGVPWRVTRSRTRQIGRHIYYR